MDQLGTSILGTKNSVSRPPKSMQRVENSLDFGFTWPQHRPHVGCEVGDTPSIWLTSLDIHPGTSTFFRTKVAHSGHDHCGTRLAHAAMGYPAASSHEVPQDLRINHQRAVKFGSNSIPRCAGT